MAFPTQSQWPQAPPFLTIASDPSKDIQRSVLFSTTPRATNDQPGQQQGAGTANISFWLGFGTSPDEVLDPKRPQNQQYCASCSGVSMKLNQPETWMVFNDAAGLSHPLHIHINPFQLLDIGVYDTTAKKTYSYANASQNGPLIQTPVWMDTIALPTAQAANKVTVCGHYITAASTCPDHSTPAKIANATVGYVKMRQTFLDYTGPFVMHCHILGHEDRGMMTNLQTLCDDGPAAGTYGQVNADGSSDNCDAFSSNAFLESQMLNNTVKEVPLPVCTPGQCDELVCAPLAKQASQQ
jgi:FtsP/CotA-like multicopper oxidase with cupredoxin domain